MRVKTFYRALRFISAIVLFFFVWTFGPIWQAVAFAAESRKTSGVKREGTTRAADTRLVTSGEKFEKNLESIRELVNAAAEKSNKGQEPFAELDAIKAKKAQIETIDAELKSEFAVTEKRLKDAKLPQVILDRHAAFVKNYEKNLAQLASEIDDIDNAKTASDRKAKIEKARLHLDKTKKPSIHRKLDPNNLPFKARKATKTVAPRQKKEDFERDFPQQKSLSKRKIAASRSWHDLLATAPKQKPILLAFNEIASDIPLFLGAQSATPQFAFTDSSPFLLALTTDQPTADELSETPEVQFTDAIRAKAQELGGNPVKIYEWVRNNIEFVPAYGSIQGADMCLQTKQCNDFDTASLLIALLRVSNIYAHYAYGTIEVPIDKVMNWAGGFTDPTSALNFIASGGIPVTGLRSGGIIYAAQMEHVWVKAWIDYIPSLGAVQKQGNTWIPLDASFKQYSYTDGVDLQTAVPFDGQSLIDQIKASATINEQESYVTNVNSTLIQTALSDYNAQLDNYVAQNLPNATVGDILGKKEIIIKSQPILPASLPYKVVVAGTETSAIPDQLRHKITVQLTDADNPGSPTFTYTASLPQLAGKRYTISYDPATDADQTTINSYVEQYATSIPAYLVQFKPVLKIEGTTVATGATVGMGNAQNLTISIAAPNNTEMVTHNLLAGDYSAIGINPSKISLDVLQNRVNKTDFSEPVGEMLHQTALSYWAEADAFNDITAKTLSVNNFRHPSELSASAKVSVSYVWGVPSSATYNRRNIDVKFDNQTVTNKTADKSKELNYMQQSGTNSSFLEGAIMDQLFGGNIGDSISAVTALRVANDQGIPVYKIDSSNITATLPKLQVADAIKTEISNAVNAGLTVQIPQTNIAQSGWTGVGYIVSNPTDGSGAYRISGGLNGGDNSTGSNTVIPLPQVPLDSPVSYVLVGLSANVGTLTATDAGILTGIKIAPALVGAGVLLVLMGIMLLIWAVIKTIVDRYQPKPRWEPYRHYTSVASLKLILASNSLKIGIDEGTYGYGVYLTRISDQPDATMDSQGSITFGPTCYLIKSKLGLSSIEKTAAYIDLLIDTNRRGVIPKNPPTEYLLMGWPGEIMPFGKDILIDGSWFPTPSAQ
jgi:transglutaminase-like putative cysteine protease